MSHQNQRPKGLSRKSYEIPDCPVCLEEMNSDLVCAPCGHVFHSMCLYQTLETNSSCPCCRHRFTRSCVVSMRYFLKFSDEADEQIQAFYSTLADSEKLHVVQIMNQYETQAKEYSRVKQHKEELVNSCREQAERLVLLEKSDKELQANLKKAINAKDQLAQRVHFEELKKKELQSFHESDQLKIEELKKLLSELRSISILKEKMDQGGQTEDRYIEEIRKGKSIEEQAKRFYEMLRIKIGNYEEMRRENDTLRIQMQEIKSSYDLIRGDIRFKDLKIDEMRKSLESASSRERSMKERHNALKRLYEQKVKEFKIIVSEGKQRQISACGPENIYMTQERENQQFNSVFLDDESSNFSNLSCQLKPNKQKVSSFEENDTHFASQSIESRVPQYLSGLNKLQDATNTSFENGDFQKLANALKDTTPPIPNNKQISEASKSILQCFLGDKQAKRQFEQPLCQDTVNLKKPKFELSLKNEQKNNQSSSSGGQGLFGMSLSKNSLLNKQQSLQKPTIPITDDRRNVSISDFFKPKK